jgi:hypothetical protein
MEALGMTDIQNPLGEHPASKTESCGLLGNIIAVSGSTASVGMLPTARGRWCPRNRFEIRDDSQRQIAGRRVSDGDNPWTCQQSRGGIWRHRRVEPDGRSQTGGWKKARSIRNSSLPWWSGNAAA